MATASKFLLERPYFLEAATGDAEIKYSARDFRNVHGINWLHEGIVTPYAFNITQSSPVGWSINVGSGHAIVAQEGTSALLNRWCLYSNDSQKIDLAAAGFNTNPASTRTHRVWLAVYDKLIDGTEYGTKILVTEDTTGAGAPPPTGAAAYLQLGYITVTNGTASITNDNITRTAQRAWSGLSRETNRTSLAAGIADASGSTSTAPVSIVYRHGRVYMNGSVMRSNGAPFARGTTYDLFIVSAFITPPTVKGLTVATSANSGQEGVTNIEDFYTANLLLYPNGTARLRTPYRNAPNFIYLDGLSWEIDY